MRSLFGNTGFRKFDLGRHVLGAEIGFPAPRLGAGSPALLQQIEAVASSSDKAALKKKYEDCQAKSGTAEIVCYAGLAADIYAAGTGSSTTQPLPITPIAPQQPAPSFPYIPVLIATAGAGLLIWFLATRGKGK